MIRPNHTRTLLLVAVCGSALTTSTLRAQTDAWADLGVSVGTYDSWGAAVAFTRIGPTRHWRARIHAQGNESWTAVGSKTIRTFGEASIQLGRPVGSCGQNWCGVYLGPAYVETTARRPMQDLASHKTIGMSAEALMVSRRRPHLTVGVFGNLNVHAPYAGMLLSMAIGKVPIRSPADLPFLR